MKIIPLIAFVLVQAVAYVGGAFVFWDFNAGSWPIEGRVLAVFFGLIMGTGAMGVTAP